MSFEDPVDSSPEEPLKETPAEPLVEALKKEREIKVAEAIAQYVPDYSDDDFLAAIANEEGVTVDELSEEQMRLAANYKFGYQFTRTIIIDKIATAGGSDESLAEYAEGVMVFERELDAFNVNKQNLHSVRDSVESITSMVPSLEKLEFWKKLFNEWKVDVVKGVDDKAKEKKVGEFREFIDEMTGRRYFPKPPERDEEEVIKQFGAYQEIRRYLDELPAEIRQASLTKNIYSVFEGSFFRLASDSHDPKQALLYLELFKDCLNRDPEVGTRYLDAIRSYGRNHELTQHAITGFETKLFPAMARRDPQVESLQTPGNLWGMRRGDFGIGDFTVHAYAVEVTPRNLNELSMALREIPTSNFANVEQNRKDALALSGTFGAFRDFVHDERPLVREVIQAMVKYYGTGDRLELASLLPQTEGYLKPEDRRKLIYDLANYDKEVKTLIGGEHRQEKVIDVLKRLEENTKLVEEAPPVTSDEEFNHALVGIQTGERLMPTEALQQALDILNTRLEKMMGDKEIGIEPNMISAIAWLDRQGYSVLKNLTYEDQQGAYKRPWFQSILKFQALTASADSFNENEFRGFVKKLMRTKDPKVAYKLVAGRTLGQIKELADMYKKANKPHINGALWSGNIAHELTTLTDLRLANTEYGRRHRNEQETPLPLRNTGD